ncbi:MAG: TolC family protein [Verrucomicrobiota bacterium]
MWFVILSLLMISGCQTYEPQFLDRNSHQAEWEARAPSSESVERFAERIGVGSSYEASFDASDGLSLGEGQRVALVFNPDLRVARLRAGVAKATAEYAGLWDDPQLSFDVLNITQNVPDPWLIGSALTFTIPVSGRLKVEKARAEAEMYAELERVAEAEWETLRDVVHSWLDWSADGYRLRETEVTLEKLNSVVATTSRLAEAGELFRTEAALFSIEQASRNTERDRLATAMEEEEQQIRSLMGLSPSAPLELVATLSAGPVSTRQKEPNENHPTLARLRREHEVADQALLREIRKQYPDVTIGPQAESDEGQSRIGFIGAIPVPILNSNKGGIAEARAEREVALAAYETEYERMVGRLAVLHARLRGVRSRLNTVRRTLVPLVDRQVADADQLLELGEGDSLVLLNSLVRSNEAKLQLIDLYLEEAQVKNEIRYLLGPDGWK